MGPEAAAYNALALSSEGNFARLSKLYDLHASWAQAWENGSPSGASLSSGWEALLGENIHLLLRKDAGFPGLLREIPHAPHALYIKGRLTEAPALAIVGTRAATPEGIALAKTFAAAAARAGLAVVSGLAFGIDAAAHAGALESGGTTFAVCAHGLDSVYPRSNRRLADRILETGALLSEYPLGMPPLAFRFLERNRIIAGLASATLLIEAPERSGALVTARFALEQNRDVFVLPGPARHPNFKGSHRLIRDGATLVTDPEELLRDMGIQQHAATVRRPFRSTEMEAVLSLLQEAGRALPIDEIIKRGTLPASLVHQTLTFLILEGAVQEEAGSYAITI